MNLSPLKNKENRNINNNTLNVFNSKPRSINYLKGDTVLVTEISEECFNSKSFFYSKVNGIEISKESNEEDKTNVSKFHPHSNKKSYKNANNLDVAAISCWEVKSDGEEVANFSHSNNKITIKKAPTEHFLHTRYILGITCENKNENHIYSWSKFHPFSFLTGATKFGKNNKGILTYPSPTFIDRKELMIKPKLTKQDILYGMEVNDKEGLMLVDKDIMKKFKGIIGDMIKQLLKAAFGTPLSLKVNLFEPKSTLQRITDYWSFAPYFLNKAADASTPLERMKNVIAFAVAGLYIPTKQLKPFNPLIGETFQGEFEDGTKVYAEHTSHYPTVASFLLINEKFKIYGYFDFSTETERFGSRINVHQKGPITIEFPKINQKIIYNMPTIKLLNAASEEGRSAIWINTIVFSDLKNNLKSVIKFGTNKNYVHGLEGLIYENKFEKGNYEHMKEVSEANDSKLDYDGKKHKVISKINGSWLKNLKFDDKENFWDIDKFVPDWIKPSDKVLPSDGRFREDLIWLYRVFNSNNEKEQKLFTEFSQGWKVTIEQTQRSEREIRKKYKKKFSK